MSELWNSIVSNEPNYYIGTIVGIQNVDKSTGGQVIEIIDGQQRITTLSIFCLALRNYINESSEKKGSKIIDSVGKISHFEKFLSHINSLRDSSVRNIRLKFTKPGLNQVYSGLISNHEDVVSALSDKEVLSNFNDTQKIFIKNYQKALSLIKEHVKLNQHIEINDLISDMGDRIANVEFVAIVTESDTDTYQLFEGLNSTSKPLSEVDLTKNAVFKALSGMSNPHVAIKNAEDLWEQLEEEFDVVNIKWLDNFLRHQWISENGYITASDLFEQIKLKKLKTKSVGPIMEYIKRLRNDAKLYIGLRTANGKYFGKKFQSDNPRVDIRRYRAGVIEKLELMGVLGLGQVYEVLLALFKKFEDKSSYTAKQFSADIDRLWLFSFAATYLTLSPSKYEKDFANFSSQVTVYNGKNFNKLSQNFFGILQKYVKNGKDDFIELFSASLRFKEDTGRKKLIKYVLYLHYGNKFKADGKNLLRFESIDHVFPKNKAVWGNHELSNHIHMIGNLCLLDREDNGALNDVRPDSKLKKKIYKRDSFKYNSWIVKRFDDYATRPVETIEERTKEIADDVFKYISEKMHC